MLYTMYAVCNCFSTQGSFVLKLRMSSLWYRYPYIMYREQGNKWKWLKFSWIMEVKRNFMRVACSDMIVKQRLINVRLFTSQAS